MKKRLIPVVLLCGATLFSCNSDDKGGSSLFEDYSGSVKENLEAGTEIAPVVQNSTLTDAEFSIVSQTPEGALTIDESTGVLSVGEATLIDFETVQSIDGVILIEHRNSSEEINFTLVVEDNDLIQSSTIAGNNGDEFDFAASVCVDNNQNIYVADPISSNVRKIDPEGNVTIFGTGEEGFVNGPGASAEFHFPQGIAVDSEGNLYVSDALNYAIRKITPDGTVSTIAGTGVRGYVDGEAAVSQLGIPEGIEVDAAGNVFFGDRENHVIRKISPDGMVSTFAGNGERGSVDGPRETAVLNAPFGLNIDAEGTLYFTAGDFREGNDITLRKVDAEGNVSTIPVNDGEGGQFYFGAKDVTVRTDGTIFYETNHTINQISPSGDVTILAGTDGESTYQDGQGDEILLVSPRSTALDHEGNLIFTDRERLRKLTFID